MGLYNIGGYQLSKVICITEKNTSLILIGLYKISNKVTLLSKIRINCQKHTLITN
jgi:hypothetical protein